MKNLLYTAFLISMFLLSCQENLEPAINPDPPLEAPERTRIKTETSSSDVITYVYDIYGRLVLYSSSLGYKQETTYGQHQIQQTNFNEQGTPTSVRTSAINEKELMTSTERSDVPGATYLYEYNDADQVIKYTSITPTGTYESLSTYSDGNMESETFKKDSALLYTYKYFYYTDKQNGLDDEYWGQPFYGKDSKNLLKSWIGVGLNGQVFTTYSYTYTFDDKGRVTTQNVIHNDQIDTYTYTYY